jgi:uncharacterized protein
VPIHFSFDLEGNCVYAFSPIGQKVAWMRDNPKVCLEIEEIGDQNHWTTVLVLGRYEEIQRIPTKPQRASAPGRLLEQRRQWWLPGAAKVGSAEHHGVVLYRIRIDRMTGRRAARQRD